MIMGVPMRETAGENRHFRIHAVIMAGGRGERFWPMSTADVPKPFIREWFGRTLFRMTIDRVRARLAPEQIWLVLGERHVDRIFEEAPEIRPDRLLIEPLGRDTAAAITFAAFHIHQVSGPDDIMVVMPCDHYIHPVEEFWRTIDRAVELVERQPDHLVTIGIPPRRPDVNYGYIEVGPCREAGGFAFYPVRSFKEKPDEETARRYLEAGRYFWNSGMFIWKVGRILELIEQLMPETFRVFETIFSAEDENDRERRIRAHYSDLPRISIDYGVMEKVGQILMIPASFEWDDIGQWEALDRVLEADPRGNRIIGDAHIEANNVTVVSPAARIVVLGVDDIVVVHHRGRVLVMQKGKGADLKKILKSIPDDWVPS